jgi:hypothetical protein
MSLIPDYGTEPEADIEGVHFQMKAPSGANIRCTVHHDVFKERLTADSDTNRLTFFKEHSSKFFDVAIDKHKNRIPVSDDPIQIGYRDVHFRDLPERPRDHSAS